MYPNKSVQRSSTTNFNILKHYDDIIFWQYTNKYFWRVFCSAQRWKWIITSWCASQPVGHINRYVWWSTKHGSKQFWSPQLFYGGQLHVASVHQFQPGWSPTSAWNRKKGGKLITDAPLLLLPLLYASIINNICSMVQQLYNVCKHRQTIFTCVYTWIAVQSQSTKLCHHNNVLNSEIIYYGSKYGNIIYYVFRYGHIILRLQLSDL